MADKYCTMYSVPEKMLYIKTKYVKKMFNLDEEKIDVHLATRSFVFGRARKPIMLISDVGTDSWY